VMLHCSDPRHAGVTTAIKKAAQVQDWDAAISAFRGVRGTPSPLNFNAILHAADKCERHEDADKLYAEMREAGHPVSASTFTPLLNIAARMRQLDRANLILSEMKKDGIDPNAHTYTVMIKAHSKVDDFDGAMQIWQEMKEVGVQPTAHTLLTLMKIPMIKGDVEGVERLIEEAAGKVKIEGSHFNSLLEACCRRHDAAAALRVLERMGKNGAPANVISYTLVMKAMRRSGGQYADLELVRKQMQAAGVKEDRFFVEQWLSCILDVDLTDLLEQPVSLEHVSADRLDSARHLIENALTQGIELTSLTNSAKEALMRIGCKHVGQQDQNGPQFQQQEKGPIWVEVPCEPGAAAAAYYWDQVSGCTQWKRPQGPVQKWQPPAAPS